LAPSPIKEADWCSDTFASEYGPLHGTCVPCGPKVLSVSPLADACSMHAWSIWTISDVWPSEGRATFTSKYVSTIVDTHRFLPEGIASLAAVLCMDRRSIREAFEHAL
jgi:hypothetical protein